MFTSGSTGSPKGVEVTHRNVARLVCNTDYASLGPDEVLLQMAPLTFDASTFEIWGALLNGATLVLWPDRDFDLATLADNIQRHRITTLWLTSSLLHVVVQSRLEALAGLRQLLAGGDVLRPDDIDRVREAYPELRIVNGYGPTETTTFSCCYEVPSDPVTDSAIPIGRPIANTTAYVLDDKLEPTPLGVPAEALLHFERRRKVIGMGVGVDEVADAHAMLCRQPEIMIDKAGSRIDERRAARFGAGHEPGLAAPAGDAFEQHGVFPRLAPHH